MTSLQARGPGCSRTPRLILLITQKKHTLGQAEEDAHDDHQDADYDRHQQAGGPAELSIHLALDPATFLPRFLETTQ